MKDLIVRMFNTLKSLSAYLLFYVLPILLISFLIFDGLYLYNENKNLQDKVDGYCQLTNKAMQSLENNNCYVWKMYSHCNGDMSELMAKNVEVQLGKTYFEIAEEDCSKIHGEQE